VNNASGSLAFGGWSEGVTAASDGERAIFQNQPERAPYGDEARRMFVVNNATLSYHSSTIRSTAAWVAAGGSSGSSDTNDQRLPDRTGSGEVLTAYLEACERQAGPNAAALVVGPETGAILRWSTAAEALFGYTEDEALGRPVADLVAAYQRDEFHAEVRRYGESRFGLDLGIGVPFEQIVICKSGERRVVHVTLMNLASVLYTGTARPRSAWVLVLVQFFSPSSRFDGQ
jgi:PAS domain S-box-containing protein